MSRRTGWEVIDTDSAEWLDRWAEVANRHSCHPLFSRHFVGPLVKYFGTPRTKAVVRDSSSIWLVERHALKCGLFMPAQMPIAPFVSSDPYHEVQDLFRVLGVRWFDIYCMDPKYQEAERGGNLPVKSTVYGTTIAIAAPGGFEDYWAARGRSLRQNIRRYAKRYGGPLDLRAFDHSDDVRDAVERYAELESKGWKGRAGTSLSPGNTQCRFYADVLHAFATSDDHTGLALELYKDGRLVASRLFIERSGIVVALKTAFDEEGKAFAPGRLLLWGALEYLFRRFGDPSIEFYTKATEDQLSWATEQRDILNLTVFSSRFWSTLSDVKSRVASYRRSRVDESAPPVRDSGQ